MWGGPKSIGQLVVGLLISLVRSDVESLVQCTDLVGADRGRLVQCFSALRQKLAAVHGYSGSGQILCSSLARSIKLGKVRNTPYW